MRGPRFWTTAAVLLAATALGSVWTARATSSGAAPRAGGMRAHIDPDTGRLTGPPRLGAQPPRPRLAAPDAGLVEAPGMSAAGGVTVHLQGRYRTTLRATVGPDGRVVTRCGE